jgi:hypothetical protein
MSRHKSCLRMRFLYEKLTRKSVHTKWIPVKNMALTFTIQDSSIDLEKGHDGDAVRILAFT